MNLISADDFDNVWKVDNNGGELFRVEDVRNLPINRVWTLVDGEEDNNIYAIPGIHFVNRIGYVVTEKEWTSGDIEAIYFDADDFE